MSAEASTSPAPFCVTVTSMPVPNNHVSAMPQRPDAKLTSSLPRPNDLDDRWHQAAVGSGRHNLVFAVPVEVLATRDLKPEPGNWHDTGARKQLKAIQLVQPQHPRIVAGDVR